MTVKRALLSVYDKTGLVDLGRSLADLGVELIGSGGTARALLQAGLEVREVSDLTGFPEVLGGRVKTLHPVIHAGLLARPTPEHMQELERLAIQPIDFAVVNLYPFARTIATPDVTLEDAVEQIDIGGVTLIRAAAKNFARVAVLADPSDYPIVLAELRDAGEVSEEPRRPLA